MNNIDNSITDELVKDEALSSEYSKQTFKIKNEKGELKEAELLLFFNFKNETEKYVIYTFNEVKKDNLIKVYSSLCVNDNGVMKLEQIPNDETWNRIKNVMRKVIMESGGE
jgi:Protein of unknown function (DUF1292).